MDYIKLKDLVGKEMTITKVWAPRWKTWDDLNKKYITSEIPQKGFKKMYGVETDKGKTELSSAQIAALLEVASEDGRSDLNGTTFSVKSNGKEGVEIRYFFDVVEKEDVINVDEPLDIPEDW